MSAQPIAPHYSTPLLALVSAIMDFPAPSAATSKDYDTLIQQLNQLCPLQHFGMLGLSEAGLQWVCEYQISDSFKLQLGLEESRISDQLDQLDEAKGWCILPVEHGQIQWLLACCQPKDLPTLRLLLECLAKRLNETQAGSQLSELASPLIRKDPDWQKKIESINRIIRLANTLPSQALFSQLEAVLRQILAIQDMLLVRIDSHRLEKIYPEQPPHSDEFITGLCHSTNNMEQHKEQLYWYSQPLRLQQQYFAHFLISLQHPLETDDRLFLDFLRSQLTLLLELRRIRQQLHDINSEDSINQRLQQLRQTNLRLQKQLKQHQELERRLQFDALHDPLTQLPNRALLMNHLNHAMTHFHRYKSPGFSLIFIDVDHFKQVNDTLGHHMGDKVLAEVASCVAAQLRSLDRVGRNGGEEFLVLLPDTSLDEAVEVAERIRHRVAQLRIDGMPEGQPVHVSIGCAQYSPLDESFGDLVQRADEAMYRAKQAGRNQVIRAE